MEQGGGDQYMFPLCWGKAQFWNMKWWEWLLVCTFPLRLVIPLSLLLPPHGETGIPHNFVNMWVIDLWICDSCVHVLVCRLSLSAAAALCLLIHNACPAARATDPVPELHTRVRADLRSKTHKRKCWYNIDIYIDWKMFLSLCSAPTFMVHFPSSIFVPLSLLSAVVCILATTGENGTTLSFCQQFRGWWKDTTATSDLISMVGMHLMINLDQKKLLHCSYLSAYFQILLCLRLW